MGWFSAPLPSRRQVYADYMLSERWRELREQALDRDGYRCRACDTAEDLHVHHRWYPESLGNEDVGDLTTLCGACHRAVHREIGTRQRRRWFQLTRRGGFTLKLFRPSPWRILG